MDYMMDIIRKRRSIRAYLEQALPAEMVESLLEAAKNAPSARNAQQLQFKVITNPALIRELSDRIQAALPKEMEGRPQPPPGSPPPRHPHIFYAAPLLIILTGPRDNPWIDQDAALAVQNIMLYAASRDLGSCFIGLAALLEKDPDSLAALHIPADFKIAAAVVVGYPAEKPVPKEKFLRAEYFPPEKPVS